MSDWVHNWLLELGWWWDKHADWADEYGENILYRMEIFSPNENHYPDHKVLCPEMPRHLRQMERALCALGGKAEVALRARYCAPLKDNGHPYSNRELSRLLDIPYGDFCHLLNSGKKNLANRLQSS